MSERGKEREREREWLQEDLLRVVKVGRESIYLSAVAQNYVSGESRDGGERCQAERCRVNVDAKWDREDEWWAKRDSRSYWNGTEL